MNRCLYCYEELNDGEECYHSKCVKDFYETDIAPTIEYSLNDMHKLAKRVVQESVTIPGVQAKLSMHLQNARNESPKLTIVGLWGRYIFKPPSSEYLNLPENEDLTMHLAEVFGIEVVPHSLIRLKSNELSYISRRIDREYVKQEGQAKKIHMEDMCQLTERLTEDKYKGSMEQIGKVILKHSTNKGFDALRLFEVTLFSFLTGNGDMHLKNFSFLYEEDSIKLAPAYDLLSTRLVIPANIDPEEMALTMNGKKSRFNIDDLFAFGKYLRLNQKQIKNVLDRYLSLLDKANEMIGISFLPDEMKEDYIKLLGERSTLLG